MRSRTRSLALLGAACCVLVGCATAPGADCAGAAATTSITSAPSATASCGTTPAANADRVCYQLASEPAVTETRTTRVCVRPASTREVHVPAKTKQVRRRVLVEPERVKYTAIPAKIMEVRRRVCTKLAHQEWRVVKCPPKDGECEEETCCRLVDVAPRYETRTERVVVRPASCRQEVIPARYETRVETVVVEPARTERVEIPAQYEDRPVQVVVKPECLRWRPVECNPATGK